MGRLLQSTAMTISDEDRGRLIALLAATAMFLSTLEYLIPKPVPFLRIGLANLPLVLVMPFFRWRDIALLALLKAVGQGVVNGTLASYVFLFSAGGTAAGVVLMIAVSRVARRHVSLIGVSIAGALASNIVQVALSVRFIFGARSWVIAPPFLAIGLVAGAVIGWVAEQVARKSAWYAAMRTAYEGGRAP